MRKISPDWKNLRNGFDGNKTGCRPGDNRHCCWWHWVAKSCPTLWPHGLQHGRPPCPSPSPRVCPSSCPLHRWCHPTNSIDLAQETKNEERRRLRRNVKEVGWEPERMVSGQPKEKKVSKRIKWSALSGAAQDILIKLLLGKASWVHSTHEAHFHAAVISTKSFLASDDGNMVDEKPPSETEGRKKPTSSNWDWPSITSNSQVTSKMVQRCADQESMNIWKYKGNYHCIMLWLA